MLVVHPHFHPRRTGVTSHTADIVPALAPLCEAVGLGRLLPASVPRITLSSLWRRSRTETVVWHAHRNNELLAGLVLKLLGRRLKLVFTRHGSNPPGRFTRLLFRTVDALITLNHEVAGLVRHPSRVIQHGVRTDRYHPPSDRRAAWRRLGLPGEVGVGVVGRIRMDKGQGDFVSALAPLLAERPQVSPVLVGRADEAAWAKALVARTDGRLTLAGEQADVAGWYQGLSIVVHPSHRESFSLVLLEALASGCCVVASRLPHVTPLIEHGVTGFLFDPGDVEALRRLLRELLDTPATVARVGHAGAAAARQLFLLDREARSLFEVYAELATRTTPGPPRHPD